MIGMLYYGLIDRTPAPIMDERRKKPYTLSHNNGGKFMANKRKAAKRVAKRKRR